MNLKTVIDNAPNVNTTSYSKLLQDHNIDTIKDLGEGGIESVHDRYVAKFKDGRYVGFTCNESGIPQLIECLDMSMILNVKSEVINPVSKKTINRLIGKLKRTDTCLYHYTKFEAATKILATKRLNFGKMEGLNDINESYRMAVFDNVNCDAKTSDILKQYVQLSLTQDCKDKDGVVNRGFDIPAMWAHYASNGRGVCFILDRKKMLKVFEDNGFSHGEVRYSQEYNEVIHLPGDNIEEELKEKLSDLFFEKTMDWQYEQEYRAIAKPEPQNNVSVDVSNSILAIVLCYGSEDNDMSVYSSAEYKVLKQLCGSTIPILTYGRFLGAPQLSAVERAMLVWSKDGAAHVFQDVAI